MARMTATGLPFLVTGTASGVPAPSSIPWLKCALTAASDRVVMTSIVVSWPAAVRELGRGSPGDAVWVEPRSRGIDGSRDPATCWDGDGPGATAARAAGRRE